MIKKLATIGAAIALLATSALPALAVPPNAPPAGCPSAFTGGQVLPADGGDPHDINTNTTDPAPNLAIMFDGVTCVAPGQQ